MIALENLQSDRESHSDYRHLHVSRYPTGEGKNIFELCKFGNPYDYINPPYKVIWEVWVIDMPEGTLPDMPNGAIELEQECEPVGDNLYPVWAVFPTIELAYAYATFDTV